MGTQTGITLVTRVRYLIQDAAGVRWTDAEMLAWLNDGLLELVTVKPTANSQRQNLALIAGPVQSLPTNAIQLLRVTHNVASGKACKLIDEDRLDAVSPGWRAGAESTDADHYMYTPIAPSEFQVYPPNNGAGVVSATVAVPFTALIALTQLLPCPDHYLPTLVDYLVYRAYSKHSKYPGNSQRAMTAYQNFVQTLGGKVQRYAALDPQVTNNAQEGGVE